MENSDSRNLQSEEVSILNQRRLHILQQLRTYEFKWWHLVVAVVAGVSYVISDMKPYASSLEYQVRRAMLASAAAVGIYFYIYIPMRYMLNARLRRVEIELAKIGSVELQENIDENFFTKLVQINFKYIDQYYLQTQEQAEKSFRVSLFAAVSGLAIVIIGILMMYTGETEPAYVTTAAGVVSEFIAAIFFYLYNRTILKMSQYHQKLVLTQNISLALKITDEMSQEQKVKSLELLIDRLTTDVNKHLTGD